MEPRGAKDRVESSPSEPMQLGQAKLTIVECQKHMKERFCFCCGSPKHQVAPCPTRLPSQVPQGHLSKHHLPHTHSNVVSPSHFLSPQNFHKYSSDKAVKRSHYIFSPASGAAGNFNRSLTSNPLHIQALDGGPIGGGSITHTTMNTSSFTSVPYTMKTSCTWSQ